MQGAWDEAVRWCGSVVARRERVDKVVGTEGEREERGEGEAGIVAQEGELVRESGMADAEEGGGGGE